jgi:hypothetical protein
VRPEQGLVAGFYEHAPRLHRASPPGARRRASWASFWCTWGWVLEIAPLWRRVTVDAPLSPWRSARWAAIALAMCVLLPGVVGGLAHGVIALRGYTPYGLAVPRLAPTWVIGGMIDGAVPGGTGGVFTAFAQFEVVRWARPPTPHTVTAQGWVMPPEFGDFQPGAFGGRVASTLLLFVVPVLLLMLLTSTRAVAQVRSAHVVRAGLLSVGVMTLPASMLAGAIFYGLLRWRPNMNTWRRMPPTEYAVEFCGEVWPFVIGVMAAWLCAYWTLALRSYRWPAGERWKATAAVLAVLAVASLVLVLPQMVYWQETRE